ncbi:MAG: lysophospholipid acyltransferase family protein [Zoogloeaceae bacterium]|jgi:KDO2-lipid IV(A) lauroyltransferase|nr:lysophospholipid acyltransferase family protein [Zoogloeaceae bacterium]
MFLFFRLLSHLPLRWLHRLGAAAGWGAYLLSPRYRRHLHMNLAQAGFSSDVALRRAAVAEAGKQALEVARIWMRSQAAANAQVVEVEGWAAVEAAQAAGRGILFLTPHLGCFEIAAQYYAAFGDITVLYRPPKRETLRRMILAGRQRERLRLAPADLSGVRSLIRALKKGEAVGMLPDQAPKAGEGVWLDFFGRPAYTMTLAARLSETGATVLMAWGERLPDGRGYRLHFHPPDTVLAGDTRARAEEINREIEALIRQCPAQYLWGYNRYKGVPTPSAPPHFSGNPPAS